MGNKTKNFVNFFYSGLSVFYPEKVFGEKSLGTFDEVFEWQGWKKSEFEEYLLLTTKAPSVDEALKTVLSWLADIEVGEYPKSNMPPRDILEADVRLQQEVKTNPDKLTVAQLKKETLLKARQRVEAATNEIHLKPVEEIPEVTLNKAEQARLENLVGVANSSPEVREEYIDYLTNEIINRLPEEARGDLSQEELRLVAKGVALDTLEKSLNIDKVLINPSWVYEALENSNSEALKQIFPDQNTRVSLANAAKNLALANVANVKQAKSLLLLVFDKKIVDLLYGPDKKILFEIVADPNQATYTINRAELLTRNQELKSFQEISASKLDVSKRLSQGLDSLLIRIRSTSFFPSRVALKESGEKVFVTTVLPARQALSNYSSYIGHKGMGILRLPFSFVTGKLKNAAVSKLTSKVGKTALGKAVKKGVKTVGKLGFREVISDAVAAIGAAAGPLAPIVVPLLKAIAWVAILIAEKVIAKAVNWIRENKGAAVAILLSPFLVAGVILGIPLLAFGAAAGMGIALLGGLTATVTGAAGFASSAFIGLTTLAISSIAVPFVVTLISIPLVVAFLLFIINSGAYIIPPQTQTFSGIIESPYIDVQKTVSPECLNRPDSGCGPLPSTVTYQIRIAAKKGALSNVSFVNKYQVLGKGSDSDLPPIPTIDPPEGNRISPVAPYTFSYTVPLGTDLDDSIVLDTLTVTADAPEQSGVVAADVATIIIGNPPASSCPILEGGVATGSYNGVSETGHGSNIYWGSAGTCFEIPAFSGCRSPTSAVDPDNNNFCSGRPAACSYYGFAADIASSGGTPVFLPSIFGESLNWTLVRGPISINGGAWGYGYLYSSGKYQIYMGHLNRTVPPSPAPSGTVIGTLFSGLGGATGPHVHIELQIDGQWVKPDFLCGGIGP